MSYTSDLFKDSKMAKEKQKMARQNDIPIKIPTGASLQKHVTFGDKINRLGF